MRSLEEWGTFTAEHWAAAGAMIDENPHWDVQHVADHFIGPAPIEPPQEEPVRSRAVSTKRRRPLELADFVAKRARRLSVNASKPAPKLPVVAAPQLPALAPHLPVVRPELPAEPLVSVPLEPPAVPERPPVPASPEPQPQPQLAVEVVPLVLGPLSRTYVLTPLLFWQDRHNRSQLAWDRKVAARVHKHGPFPERSVIIVCIRYSRGQDMGQEQYDLLVQRCVEAASTLICQIRSQEGQANRQFLIYPWIRSQISSTDNWFKTPFRQTSFRNGVPRTTTASCRLQELVFVLDNVRPTTEIWWLSIGIDALTTDVENLRKAQDLWPGLHFTLAVMVHARFAPSVDEFGDGDICPPRPACGGMRIRIYSFARLLTGTRPLSEKLLAIWRHINVAKLSGQRYDRYLAFGRNVMPVSPGGLPGPSLRDDRM